MAALIDLLRSIYDRSADAVVATTGGDAPAVVYANPAFAALCGASAGTLIGRPPAAVWPASLGDGVLERVGHALPIEAETVEIPEDGRSRWIELTVRPLAEAADRAAPLLVIARDITARRAAEAAREAEHQRLSRLLAASPAVTYGFGAGDDFRPTFVSRNIADLLGYEPGEDLEGPAFWRRSVHPDDLATVEAAFARLHETDRHVVEYRFRRKDGRYCWISDAWRLIRDEAGRPVEVVGSWSDITARKTVEAALAAERALVRTLFEGWPDFVYVKDARSRFLKANAATAAIMGAASPADLVGRTDFDFYPANIAEELFASEQRLVATGQAVVGLEEQVVTPDGAEAWVSTTQLPLRDEQDRVVGLVGIGRDITERKAAERLKSEFVSTVSHELRTPLTSIAGSLGLLAGGVAGALPDKAQHLVAIARKNSERLVRLINDILDREKIESGRMEFALARTDLAALVEQVVEQNQAFAAAHGVTIAFLPPPRRLAVEVDPDRLSQVVTNLLSNACKFSPAGETVTVTLVEHSGNARLLVADEGPGIPAAFRARLFQPFAQADGSDARRKGGTGLGLSIAKSIVERHGGRIGYDSEVGQGTIFHVDLPLAEPPVPAAGGRILVCEDDPDIARLLQLALEGAGYAVDTVDTAADAKQRLAAGGYAAMTLDLVLPDQDGVALIDELRRHPATRRLPVVVVSADERGRLARSGALDVVDWLRKPVDLDRLVAAVIGAAGRPDRPRILHVEDDADTRTVLAMALAPVAELVVACDLESARAVLARQRCDLAILDLGLPDGSGLDLLPLLGQGERPVPVILFSAMEPGAEIARRVSRVLTKSRTPIDSLAAMVRAMLEVRQGTAPLPAEAG